VISGFAPARIVHVQIAPSSVLVVDTPSQNAAVGPGFMVGGWAADFGAASGGGIDVVDVYAYPLGRGGAPILLGGAAVNGPRPGVGAYFGAQFSATGFNLLAPCSGHAGIRSWRTGGRGVGHVQCRDGCGCKCAAVALDAIGATC
jgi:hypothetical protein